MDTPRKKIISRSPELQKIEDEIEELKLTLKLRPPHLTRSQEDDYDIKSQIIEKQNEMIELLIKQSHH